MITPLIAKNNTEKYGMWTVLFGSDTREVPRYRVGYKFSMQHTSVHLVRNKLEDIST